MKEQAQGDRALMYLAGILMGVFLGVMVGLLL